MKWIVARIKWIMLVSGILTMTMLYGRSRRMPCCSFEPCPKELALSAAKGPALPRATPVLCRTSPARRAI